MAIRFTVGQLAKLCQLSKQALIYYDREGVFCPKEIDAHNGYRYYTADQLEVLDSILILKEIGLSLAEIKGFMEGRCQKNALAALKQQHGRLLDKISGLTIVAKRLAHKIDTLEQYQRHSPEPQLVYLPRPQPLVVQPVQAPGGILQVDLALKPLFRKAQAGGHLHFYQIGTMIGVDALQNGEYLKASYSFFPLEEGTHGQPLHRPGGWHVRGFHRGTYESVGKVYQKMLDFAGARGHVPHGFSYEYAVLDSLTTKASAEYVTEIYLPVRPLA